MRRLEDKIALVTGGARGAGAAAAVRLAANGARVVVGDVAEDDGRSTVDRIRSDGGTAAFVRLDVSCEEDWSRAVARTTELFGGLDVLVNNAGVLLYEWIETTTFEQWQRLRAVNLDGVFLGTRIGISAMRERARTSPSGGAIVNVSSTNGIVGAPGVAAYCMTKGGVRLFTRATALECARRGYRIRANAVCPGVVDTDMGRSVAAELVRTGQVGDERTAWELIGDSHPMKRVGQPVDVAEAIVFLASDEASFITGTELVVDGGLTAQ